MPMGMIPIFSFVGKPAVGPDLGGSQDQLAGPQDDAHRFIVKDERESGHVARLGNHPATASQN